MFTTLPLHAPLFNLHLPNALVLGVLGAMGREDYYFPAFPFPSLFRLCLFRFFLLLYFFLLSVH